MASIPVAPMGWFNPRIPKFRAAACQLVAATVRFGAPLVPQLGHVFHDHGRPLVCAVLPRREALGLFAVGAKFSFVGFGRGNLCKAWWPIAMDSMHSDDGRKHSAVARLYMGIACAGVVGPTILSPRLVRLQLRLNSRRLADCRNIGLASGVWRVFLIASPAFGRQRRLI